MPMPLNQLFSGAQSHSLIRNLCLSSAQVQVGDLFFAVPGIKTDGRTYIKDAVKRGAAAVIYEANNAPPLPESDVPMLALENLADEISAIAGRFYGHPAQKLQLIGITGTNGKTSVSQLLAQALAGLGERCGIIGTLGNGFYGVLQESAHTTPDAIGVQASLARLVAGKAKSVAMEVSSHALVQGRVAALDFSVAVLTNLSRDHLDYHGSMDAYAAAKARLFAGCQRQVLNLDDQLGQRLVQQAGAAKVLSYSLDNPKASLYCRDIKLSDKGLSARLISESGEGTLRSPLLGRFNLANLLAVIGTLLALGYPLSRITALLPRLAPPPGRLQRLGGGHLPLVTVDYAHTPDALKNTLSALRAHCPGRLLCLFGCGGERDKGKRPLMAQVAERLADGVWVTDDNPRGEDRKQIIQDIREGFANPQAVQFVADRDQAIAQIIHSAKLGDVVLLAGKGHENYQELNGKRLPFSDLQQASLALLAWERTHA